MNNRIIVVLVFLGIICSASLSAQTEIGLKGIGGKAGLVNIEGNAGSALGFGLIVDLGTIIPNLGIQANIDFWNKTFDNGSFGNNEVKAKWRDIAIAVNSQYFFPLSNTAFRPFASGGLALHMFKASTEGVPESNFGGQSFGGDVSATSSGIGFDIGGGALFNMSPRMDLLGELKYRVGEADHLSIKVGALFKLGE